jgi:hypothetical protein
MIKLTTNHTRRWSRKFGRFLAETETSSKLLFSVEIGRNRSRIFGRTLMIYYKAAFETPNCLRPCIAAYLHRIPLRHEQKFATPALLCFF